MVRDKERSFGLGRACTREVEAGEVGEVGEREPRGKEDGDPGCGRLGEFRGGEGRGCEREPDEPRLGRGAGRVCGIRWLERVCVGAYGV